MIDPSTVTSDAARRAQSTFPAKVRSEATISYKPPDLSSMSDESDSEDDEDAHGLTVSPADIRVIRRLAARVVSDAHESLGRRVWEGVFGARWKKGAHCGEVREGLASCSV